MNICNSEISNKKQNWSLSQQIMQKYWMKNYYKWTFKSQIGWSSTYSQNWLKTLECQVINRLNEVTLSTIRKNASSQLQLTSCCCEFLIIGDTNRCLLRPSYENRLLSDNHSSFTSCKRHKTNLMKPLILNMSIILLIRTRTHAPLC